MARVVELVPSVLEPAHGHKSDLARARRQEGGEHEAREVEALLDEVERIESPLAVLQGARRDLHHVVAYDGEEGDIDANVAPTLVLDLDGKALDDIPG